MDVKKILLFTGKFPACGSGADGGSLTVSGILGAIKGLCRTDAAFTRTPDDRFAEIDGVENVRFQTYVFRSDDKFERRLKNKDHLLAYLRDAAHDYDRIIITHCSKAFGLHTLSEKDRQKTVLFPMYLSPSYRRSGEIPPEAYEREERLALNAAGKLITPSLAEKADITDVYGVPSERIVVIPRGFSPLITPNVKRVTEPVRILYIAAFKEQKNNVEAVALARELCLGGINAQLHIAGEVQDRAVFDGCKEYIRAHGMQDRVVLHGALPQQELAALIGRMHINISTSNWETYGRGIFEGMAGGLPTVVYDRLSCVKQYLTDGNGIRFVTSHEMFLSELRALVTDETHYAEQAARACSAVAELSAAREKTRLTEELL